MGRCHHASRWGVWNLALVLIVASTGLVQASQSSGSTADQSNVTVDPKLYKTLQFRSLGFNRGGRSTAVAGVPDKPLTYYFGSTGGGVWKTNDAGITWANVSDGFFEAGSIGAIAVADSDPNVIYVGTGSACPRGNISQGVGAYRSTDAGKAWKHIGLREAGLIGRSQDRSSRPGNGSEQSTHPVRRHVDGRAQAVDDHQRGSRERPAPVDRRRRHVEKTCGRVAGGDCGKDRSDGFAG